VSADGRLSYRQLPDTAFELEADLILLAMGFEGPVKSRLLENLSVELDGRGNIAVDEAHRTRIPGVFAAGDAHRGASLIVWAIREGRDAADSIDCWLRATPRGYGAGSNCREQLSSARRSRPPE
jgi:glutamate synthase (NADPH/NADH) small chain